MFTVKDPDDSSDLVEKIMDKAGQKVLAYGQSSDLNLELLFQLSMHSEWKGYEFDERSKKLCRNNFERQ